MKKNLSWRIQNKMPFCGFNQKMIKGLHGFQSGLVEHGIIARSKKQKQSFEKTMDKELSDMSRFMKETYKIKDPEIRELIQALTKYACAFYKMVQKKGIKNYMDTINFLNNFYFEMDDKYYSELESDSQDMEKLVHWINGRGQNATKRI